MNEVNTDLAKVAAPKQDQKPAEQTKPENKEVEVKK